MQKIISIQSREYARPPCDSWEKESHTTSGKHQDYDVKIKIKKYYPHSIHNYKKCLHTHRQDKDTSVPDYRRL